MSAFSPLGSFVSDAQSKAYDDQLALKEAHDARMAKLKIADANRVNMNLEDAAFQAKLDKDNKSAFGDDFGKEVANTGTGTQKVTVEGVDTQGNKTTTVTEASKDAKDAFVNNQGLGVTRRPDALDLPASQPTVVAEEDPDAQRAPAQTPFMTAIQDQYKRQDDFNARHKVKELVESGVLPESAIPQNPYQDQIDRGLVQQAAGIKNRAIEGKTEEGNIQIEKIKALNASGALEDDEANAAIAKIKTETNNSISESESAFEKSEMDAINSPENVMTAAQAAGAVYSDGTIDQEWLDNYNRSASPSDFDTNGIEEERKAVPFDRSILKSEKEKAKAAEEAKKLAETDPGTFSEVMGGITDWFKTEGNDEEGFWDSIGGWVEENPVWANTIASGVASYIETGDPYEAVGKSIKGAVSGMDSKKKAEAAARKEDIDLNKLYTGASIEKYRETNRVTDLVGRLGAPEISGKANQYKAVNGKTYGVWNKDGVSYTRINGKFVPAPEEVLTGKDVSSATAENDTWNGIGKSAVANVIDQIKSQKAEYRIPTPSLSMSNKIQKGVNALRKAFPGIDPNDPNIGSAVDDWFAANNARFEEDPKNFKWDTNVEKYMMNNIIMGKTTAENIDMANAFEIGGDGKNQHDVNVEETALAWNKINAFVSSNKEDEFVTPAQGMKYGYDLYLKDWKPGQEDEDRNVKAARDAKIPPFIYFMNTVDFK
jgi:hypothetical protein